MNKPMTIRQAIRWAESKDAMHLSVVYDASWKAGYVVCIGSRAKCADYLRASGCEDKHFNTSAYFTGKDGRTYRIYDLDTLAEEQYESDAEANLPERDYRCEAWA